VGRKTFLFVKGKKDLSASERERRDEENRRRMRQDDVVIGKTSAKKGEKDCALDPQATQQEFLKHASAVEQEVFRLTEAGMGCLKSLQLEKADEAFGQVFDLRPSAYLWQAGVVKFYLGDLDSAADIFARNAVTYETRFGGPASEERIWRDACALKMLNSKSRAEKKDLAASGGTNSLVAEIPDGDENDKFQIESRKAIRLVRDLFAASVCSDLSGEVLARAKLRSLGGPPEEEPKLDRKMWKLYSWFYLGLHYDAIGEKCESKKCMKMALRLRPSSGKGGDIIHTLPLLHMSVRDWFDDDDFDANPMITDASDAAKPIPSPAPPTFPVTSMAYADPVIEGSIWQGVRKMKRTQLIAALRLRGLKGAGSKESLQERLFYSLMDDAGFSSGFAP